MKIKFWGVRGSLPCPYQTHLHYGGNTSCVEVSCADRTIIFDAGSGLRHCGEAMTETGVRQADLFLSHFHHDHLMGFPFFAPATSADFSLTVRGPRPHGQTSTGAALSSYLSSPFFPISIEQLMPRVACHDLRASDTVDLGDIQVSTIALNHPGGALGYRIHCGSYSVCYITDVEHTVGEIDEGIANFVSGTNLLIYDSTYTDEEFSAHKGWGHSTWQQALRIGDVANATQVAIFHHDPGHDDVFMANVERHAMLQSTRAIVARDGMEITIG